MIRCNLDDSVSHLQMGPGILLSVTPGHHAALRAPNWGRSGVLLLPSAGPPMSAYQDVVVKAKAYDSDEDDDNKRAPSSFMALAPTSAPPRSLKKGSSSANSFSSGALGGGGTSILKSSTFAPSKTAREMEEEEEEKARKASGPPRTRSIRAYLGHEKKGAFRISSRFGKS